MSRWDSHHRSVYRRGLYSFILVAAVMIIGTMGIRYFEHLSLIDAFYFMSMLATAQGPLLVPATAAGKLFTSFMAFVSVGAVVAASGYLFGPFFTQIWKLSVKKIEQEERILEDKLKGKR